MRGRLSQKVLNWQAKRDVMLCMEPLSSDQTNFITNPDKAVEMVNAVNHPNFEMILDVCSTAKEGLDMPTQIRNHAPHVAHFHSNDDNGYLPGSGGVDYPPIIEALKEIDYKELCLDGGFRLQSGFRKRLRNEALNL